MDSINPVELVNTTAKVGIKLDKYTAVGFVVGAVVTTGGIFAVKKIRTWRAERKLVVE